MDTTFLTMAGVWFVVVASFMVWSIRHYKKKGPAILRQCAEEGGWQIERYELDGHFGQAPFKPKGRLQRTVCRVWIRNREGECRWARVRGGDPWWASCPLLRDRSGLGRRAAARKATTMMAT